MEHLKFKLLLGLFFIIPLCGYTQTEPNVANKKGAHIEGSYMSSTYFGKFGYQIVKDNLSVFPYFGLNFDFTEAGEPSAEAGLDIRKDNFFTSFAAVGQILPSIFIGDFSNEEFSTMDVYGRFVFGYDFHPTRLTSTTKVGLFGEDKQGTKDTDHVLKISETISAHTVIYDDSLNKIKNTISATFNMLPEINQYSYNVNFQLPMSFLTAHKWLEFAFLYDLSYSDYFSGSEEDYSIHDQTTVHEIMYGSSSTEYEFSTFLQTELRLYFASLSPELSRFYLLAFNTIGYGVEENDNINNGNLFWMVGGGFGYKLFDSLPLQVQMGVDNDMNFVMNLTFISLI